MRKKIFSILGAALAMFSLASCDLDINKDPYDVTELDVAQLLTAVEYEVGISFAGGNYLLPHLSTFSHHTVSREVDNYAIPPTYATLGNTWAQAYRYGVKNCDELIAQGDSLGYAIYAGIGRVLRVHEYMNIVDLWGDVPYTEANKPGNLAPKVDKSADIYNALLKELDKAIANFGDNSAANTLVPGANDLFYKGNVKTWVKAANTLKLKLLVQSRKAKSQIDGWDGELRSLLAANNFLGTGEDLQFPHSSAQTPADERNGVYVDEYQGGQKSVWISPWFYEALSGLTYNFKDNPLRGIRDPRRPYFYYNQSTPTESATNRTDYRDGAFVSILFGSNSGYTSGTQESAMTVIGIYPCGGIYDDGKGKTIASSDGTGAAPDKMLMAYSVPFMKAELVLVGEASGDAKALLEEGIKASIANVNAVSLNCDKDVPTISEAATTTLVEAVLAAYDEGDNAKKLEIVMTQKWIANFFNPVEAYNDIRRTGYPKVFKGDENNMGWTPYAQEVAATPSLTSFNLVSLLDYPRILWYADSEASSNPNVSNKDRVVSNPTVFWDVQ